MQLGRWQVEREVARGATAVVLRGHDPRQPDRPVAIKLFHPAANPERAAREARALARLRHPHVVTLHEAGVDQGRLYLVLDLVEGESLQARLDRAGPLELREALALARDLAGALAAAHAEGILHRDVKPDNVLLGREGRVWLSDFGLARLEEEAGLSVSGQMLGTPGYWPPEQAAGQRQRIGPASDVYALGATLHAALTGGPPFEAESLVEALQKVLETPPSPPSARRHGVPSEVDALVLRCLEKDPAARPASAVALARELEGCLGARGARRPGLQPATWLAAGLLLASGASAAWLVLQGRGSAAGPPAAPVESPPPGLLEASRAERWAEAEAGWAAWVGSHPAHAEGWARLGYARQNLGRLEEARAPYARALELDPELWLGLVYQAGLDLAEGRPREALAGYERAERVAPGHLDVLHQVGAVHDHLGDMQAAERAFSAVLERAPTRLAALLNRARARSRQANHAGARQDVDRAFELAPQSGQVAERRAQVLVASGDLRGALASLDAFATTDLAEVVGLGILRASLHLWLGEWAQAEEVADMVLRVEGEGPRRLDVVGSGLGLRAFARWHRGDRPGALQDLAAGERVLRAPVGWAVWRAVLSGEREPLLPHAGATAWPGPLARHLLGQVSAGELERAASSAPERCEAECLLGLVAEQRQDRAEAARRYGAAVATGADPSLSYAWARTRLGAFERE